MVPVVTDGTHEPGVTPVTGTRAIPRYPAGRHRGALPHTASGTGTAPGPTPSSDAPPRPPGERRAAREAREALRRAVRPAADDVEPRGRLAGLDLARGVAVLSMLVAHLSPVGGPANITENLTAPLFALVIGTSMGLLLTRRPTPGAFLLDTLLRASALVALGVALQHLYTQIDVVLPYLGVLLVVLAPLALGLWRAPVLTVGLATAGAVLSPLLMERARDALTGPGSAGPGSAQATVLDWLAAGQSYRLTSFLPMALAGLVLALALPRAGEPPRGVAVAGILGAGSLGAYLLGYASDDGARAYSGTTAEIVGATFLAAAAVVAAFVVLAGLDRLGARRVAAPLLATGRMALTAYTLQVLFLALVSAVRGGAPDDSWVVLGLTTLVVFGACWALDRWWGTGPLEWLLHRARVPGRREAPAA